MYISTFAYHILAFSLTTGVSFAHPFIKRAQLPDCLYDKNPNFIKGGNLISTAEIEACTKSSATKRDVPRVYNGPPPSLDEINMNTNLTNAPFIVPGELLVKLTNGTLQTRDQPPALGFFDDVADGPIPILTNFLEPADLVDYWSYPICSFLAKNLTNAPANSTATFNYNIQGTHKIADSLDHKNRLLNLYVTFTPDGPVLSTPDGPVLSQVYNTTQVCEQALKAAAQNYRELNYGAFGLKKVDSVVNNHQIEILQVETPEQVASLTANETQPTPQKRSSFGSQMGVINIAIGDQATGIETFDLKTGFTAFSS